MENLLNKMMAWEDDSLSQPDTIELFQHLIDTGQAWTLQGAYGRTAAYLIDEGYCTKSKQL
jgi:hypothetical protein